jgi:hypothetical protein
MLDIARPDVVSGGVDLSFLGIDDEEPALRIPEADVAGEQLAAGSVCSVSEGFCQ